MSDTKVQSDAETGGTAESTADTNESQRHKSDSMRVEGPSRFVNPVLWREARTRFDSRRTGWLVFGYLILLGTIISLFYLSQTSDSFGEPVVTRFGTIGRTVFESSLLTTALLLMLLVPPQAASSITGERERQTLMPIQITLMRPHQIVLGKLGSSLIFTSLLIVLTSPLLALSYMIGGVSIVDVLAGVAMLMLIAALTTSIGVWWSATVRRSSTAIVLTLLTLFALTAGTAMLYQGFVVIDEHQGHYPGNGPEFVLGANPIAALASAMGQSDEIQLTDQFGQPVQSSPLSAIKRQIFQRELGTSSFELITKEDALSRTGMMASMDFGSADSSTSDSSASDSSASDSSATDTSSAASTSAASTSTDSSDTTDDESATEMVMFDNNTGRIIDQERVDAAQHAFPLYGDFIIFSAIIIALAIWGASHRLRTPAKKER